MKNEDATFSIVLDSNIGSSAKYGVRQILDALEEQKIAANLLPNLQLASGDKVIVVGRANWSLVKQLVKKENLSLPSEPESIFIKRISWGCKEIIVILGSDDRGVMYASLEVARAIRLKEVNETIFETVEDVLESPDVAVRGICMFLHNEDLEKEWYYSEEFWRNYFNMLAVNRFNSFNLIFGHQTSYLAPPYPFLMNVEEFPNVQVTRLTDEHRKKSLKMLQFISGLAEELGIDFIMGIWQHRAWSVHGFFFQPSMVEGLTDENIKEYSRLALTRLLRLCPGIKTIQLRVNNESGIPQYEQLSFYRDSIFRAMRECGRPVSLDLRGWGILPETKKAAIESGLKIRLSMKYWAEHMGPPYQPAIFHLGYSFEDFLQHQRKYDIWYQVWSLGSHRLLLWGDPGYVKRFASSCHLGRASGFEICAPLSQKGFGNEPGVWRIFTSRDYEFFRWEFERYWMFYLLFGRLTYNPGTSETIWMRELNKKFGLKVAPHIMKAYENGSKVLSYIVAYNLSNPSMYIWPEKRIGGLIDYYIETQPSDQARFFGIKEYVDFYLNNYPSAKITPKQISQHLQKIAEQCSISVKKAKKNVGTNKNKEFTSTMLDMEILSGLAQYHSEKVLAGEQLAFFYATGDLWSLQRAKKYAHRALKAWMHIVDLANGIYNHRMIFGPADIGHWKDNIVFVKHDITRIDESEQLFRKYGNFDIGFDFGKKPEKNPISYRPSIVYSHSIERRFNGAHEDTIYNPKIGYGWIETNNLKASPIPNIPLNTWETLSPRPRVNLPGNALYNDYLFGTTPATFRVDLKNGWYDLTLIIKITETHSREREQGPMYISVQGKKEVNSLQVPVGKLIEHTCKTFVSNRKLLIEFSSEPRKNWIVNGLIIKESKPHIVHIKKPKMVMNEETFIEATVTSIEKLYSVILYYRNKNADVYRSMLMQQQEEYCYITKIPKEDVSQEIIEYYIKATDHTGNITLYPDQGALKPISMIISEDNHYPTIIHKKIKKCSPNKPLTIQVYAKDKKGLHFVRLHYRALNAQKKFKTIKMSLSNEIYKATLPPSEITNERDLMYYIEAVNTIGNGTFFPDGEKERPYIVVNTRKFP